MFILPWLTSVCLTCWYRHGVGHNVYFLLQYWDWVDTGNTWGFCSTLMMTTQSTTIWCNWHLPGHGQFLLVYKNIVVPNEYSEKCPVKPDSSMSRAARNWSSKLLATWKLRLVIAATFYYHAPTFWRWHNTVWVSHKWSLFMVSNVQTFCPEQANEVRSLRFAFSIANDVNRFCQNGHYFLTIDHNSVWTPNCAFKRVSKCIWIYLTWIPNRSEAQRANRMTEQAERSKGGCVIAISTNRTLSQNFKLTCSPSPSWWQCRYFW